jgi:hypothetical protein
VSSIGRHPIRDLPSRLLCLFGSAQVSKKNFPNEKHGAVFMPEFPKMKNDRGKIAAKGENPIAFQQIFLDLDNLFLSDPVADFHSVASEY